MLKLLRFEYLLNRRQLLIVLAIYTAFFAYTAAWTQSPRVFLVTTSVMIGLGMPVTIFGREDKFKTSPLVCSLPVRRSTVVLSKYATAWAAIGIGMAWVVLSTAIFPFAKFSVGEILTARNLVASLFLISLVFVVILPFIIRFGLVGIIIFLVSTQLLGILALILAQLTRGPGNPLRFVFRGLERGFRALLVGETRPGFLLSLLAAAILVNAASLFISRALYARRDL